MAIVEELKILITANAQTALRNMTSLKDQMVNLKGAVVNAGSLMTRTLTPGILGLGAAALKASSDFEQQEAAFRTMLGSGERATQLLGEIEEFSSRTPFQLNDLNKGAQTMLAFGIEAENIMPTLSMLGDVSLGNADKFQSLTLAFSQIQSTGRLMGQDLLQLINAGFNPLVTISEKTGESMTTLKDRMSAGAISAEEVSEAFKSATSEGGLFFGALEGQADTLAGQLSTLKDNLAAAGRELGTVLLPIAKEAIEEITKLVKAFGDLDEDQKKMIIRMAAIAAAAGPLIGAINGIAGALTFLAANPIVAVIAGIGLIGVAMVRQIRKGREYAAEMEALGDQVGKTFQDMTQFELVLSNAAMAGVSLEDAMSSLRAEGFVITKDVLIDLLERTGTYGQELQALKSIVEDTGTTQSGFTQLIDETSASTDDLIAKLEALSSSELFPDSSNVEMQDFVDILNDGSLVFDDFNDNLERNNTEMRKAAIRTEMIKNAHAALSQRIEETEENSDSWLKALQDGINANSNAMRSLREETQMVSTSFLSLGEDIAASAQSIGASAMVDYFQALGSGTADAEKALTSLISTITNSIAMLLLNGGLQILPVNPPAGLALIAASGLVALGGGALGKSIEEGNVGKSFLIGTLLGGFIPGAIAALVANNNSQGSGGGNTYNIQGSILTENEVTTTVNNRNALQTRGY